MIDADSTKKRIMIVEDNALNLKLFKDLLESCGYEIMCTHDGFKVLDMIHARKPNLIIMDIQLPEVSGLEVVGWLNNDQEAKDIPVIAITAFAMRGDEEKIRAAGCDDYISKPIAVHKFIEVVKKYL
ncbi:MAG: response regulator [Alphaproteobacteria bacterium]|nr:response regulator [Alphaproteobacteria bacterium]MCL2505883.1 response regulator [Alphaproteobacteria bacterium]